MNTALVATMAVAVVAAGGFFVIEELATEHCEGEAVPSLDEGAAFAYRLTMWTPQGEAPVRTCMYAADGTKLFDQALDAHADKAQYWDLHLAAPIDAWIVDRDGSGGMAFEGGLATYSTTQQCPDSMTELVYEDLPGRGGLIAVQCEDDGNYMPEREPAQQRLQQAGSLPMPEERILGGGGALAVATGVGGLLVLVLRFRTPLQWGLIGLFTRILPPRVLEHHVRSDIHQLVLHEPGIRPVEIGQRLELAAGQTTHHLRVLVGSGSLSLVRQGFAKHYFVRGQHPPQRMQQLAALRSVPVAKLNRALRENPGAPLSMLANLGGLSRPRASRLARRLQALGLARAERHGKHVRLYPLS